MGIREIAQCDVAELKHIGAYPNVLNAKRCNRAAACPYQRGWAQGELSKHSTY